MITTGFQSFPIPERQPKPRSRGLSMMIDWGMGITRQSDNWCAVALREIPLILKERTGSPDSSRESTSCHGLAGICAVFLLARRLAF